MRVPWSDTRLVFALVAAAIAFGLLVPVKQHIEPQKPAEAVYKYIENLPEGSAVLLSIDFDPQVVTELRPMAEAILTHCLRRNLHVIGMTFGPQGAPLGDQIFRTVAQEEEFRGKQLGRDYVYLGYKPGDIAQVITNMGENLPATFPQDYQNRPTATMPIFRDVKSLKDLKYLVDFASAMTPEYWIPFGADKYKIAMAVGCTAVVAPDMYVRLNARQINGLVAGLRGAADYETLIEKPGLGIRGMFAQSVTHVMIVLAVIAGNIAFFVARRRKK
jgi:hypothetical protein